MSYPKSSSNLPTTATIDAAMKRAHQLRSEAFRGVMTATASLVVRSVGSMTMQRPFLTMTRHTHEASPCQ